MCELTGQCKADFDNWIKTEMYYLGSEPLSELFMNTLYMEFFDSVNYLIQVKGRLLHYHKSTLIEQKFDSYVYHKKLTMRCGFNTRTEAVTHAISRANFVYNETHQKIN